MNVKRAIQIINSPKDVLVVYNHIPVWIQHVNEDAETARVYTAANPDNELEIPIALLQEG